MATGFKVAQIGNYAVDVDDILIRREYFSNGTLWGWGRDNYGQLGDNTTSGRSSPITTSGGETNWKQVAVGSNNSAAIKTDGTLWTWGRNSFGQLGDGTLTHRSSPGITAGGGANWKQVTCAYNTAAIKTDGTLWTWGYNGSGGLGDGTSTNRSSPVTTAGGGTNWKQVSGGSYNLAAIKTDGTLWAWGDNTSGKLGDGTTSSRFSPVTTAGGGTNWKQVSAWASHTAAIKSDGTLWTWGDNLYGQLGNNTAGATSSILSPATTAGGGTNWKQVSVGTFHTAAIKSDGTLWTWGRNLDGQLGSGAAADYANKSSPGTTFGGGTNWKQVSSGSQHTAAIKTDGTLWVWGYNGFGQLGDGTTAGQISPVTVAGGATNWKQVACDGTFTFAVTDLTI